MERHDERIEIQPPIRRDDGFRRVVASAGALVLMSAILGGATGAAADGITFSVDHQSTSIGDPAAFGGRISAGSILTAGDGGAPGPNPPVVAPSSGPGVVRREVTMGRIYALPYEVDALSFGADRGRRFYFSVDEHATGNPLAPTCDVAVEAAIDEASGDVFRFNGVFRASGTSTIPGASLAIDGNGSGGYPGIGVIEPNPSDAVVPDAGDNLDALSMGVGAAEVGGRVFFSLDGSQNDPYESGTRPNYDSAGVHHGLSGADVLVLDGTGLNVYASFGDLGLVDSDDVDALILKDDGDGIFDQGSGGGEGGDKIFFSIRRASPTVGVTDCRLGIPITEGDLLVPPVSVGGPPCIYIPAEALCLDAERNGEYSDDLNAAHIRGASSGS
jgi:hypothetical protein